MLHRANRQSVAGRVRALLAGDDTETVALGGARSPSLTDRLRARVPMRAAPSRRAAIGMGIAALVAAIVAGWWVLAARPHAMPVVQESPVSGAGAASPSKRSSPSAGAGGPVGVAPTGSNVIVVDVVGNVRHPGLYRLPAGSRVADAITAAGGARPGFDTSAINLAARIADGQQIVVAAAPPAPASGAAAGATGTSSGGGSVSLNSATLDQLQTLPGVGPVLAQHIIDWRTAHGGFSSVDELNDVPGIGDVKFAALKGSVTL